MTKGSKRIGKIAKYIVLFICLLIEVFYFFNMSLSLYEVIFESSSAAPAAAGMIMTIHGGILIGITIVGFLGIKDGYSSVIISGGWMKLGITCMGMGCLFLIPNWIYERIEWGAVVTCFAFSFLICFTSIVNSIYPKDSIQVKFRSITSAYFWETAAEWEYTRLYNNKNRFELAEEERSRIHEYACIHVAYFLVWLVKNDYMSEKFQKINNKGIQNAEFIEGIKKEQLSPVEFLSDEFKLSICHLSKEILGFVGWYFCDIGYPEVRRYTYFTRQYWIDYYKTIQNENHTFYCIDFSWETYHRLKKYKRKWKGGI